MLGLGQLREKRGKSRPLVGFGTSHHKIQSKFVVRKWFFALGNRASAWIPEEGIKAVKSLLLLCQTQIVFSDEYPEMGIPNRATANDTRSPNYNGIPFSLGISRRGSYIVAVQVLRVLKQSFEINFRSLAIAA